MKHRATDESNVYGTESSFGVLERLPWGAKRTTKVQHLQEGAHDLLNVE